MRLYVVASQLNTNGVCTGIRSECDGFESITLDESYSDNAQKSCVRSAKILRDAAEKFEELAKEPDETILKRTTHIRLNGFECE